MNAGVVLSCQIRPRTRPWTAWSPQLPGIEAVGATETDATQALTDLIRLTEARTARGAAS